MENLCIARIAKNIAYFLVPVFILILIASIIGSAIADTDYRFKDADNYYETELFSNQYFDEIERKYSTIGYDLESNLIIADSDDYQKYQENQIETNKEKNNIYYVKNYNSNFKYLIIDRKNEVAKTNLEHTMLTDSIEEIKQILKQNSIYWNYEKGKVDTSIQSLSLENIRYTYTFEEIMNYSDQNIDIYTVLLNDTPYNDDYAMTKTIYDLVKYIEEIAPILIPISLIILVILAIIIIKGIGKRAKQQEIYLDTFDKWKLEIVICIGILLAILGILAGLIFIETRIKALIITSLTVGTIILYLDGILMLETIVKRIKTHTLWKTTILYSICEVIKKLIKNRKITTKLILAYGGFCSVGFFLSISIVNRYGEDRILAFLLLVTLGVLTFVFLFNKINEFEKIENALKSIYEGNTNIHLNSNELKGVLKQLAIYIEDIAGGLSNAVNESLKSERLKTELITNVSHDIKTPLTSIINYVDLLKKEKMPNEKAEEYLNILDSKSQRLKKLTEDLVEASKASSGNIKLQIEKINVNEILKQVSGEFEDRFKNRGLEQIVNLPEEDIYIEADGRYLYRVLENIYSNVTKYAMENSRVYLDVVVKSKSVVIQMKNISQEKLNISAEELMQRFVRGEKSRNTEGSGLGLSIASSLTELQGGKFHIYLDGDLFKVTIGFEIKKEQ